MLKISDDLPSLKEEMDLLCLMGLALTIILVFSNLASCILGSFRLKSPTYDEEVKKLEDDLKAGKITDQQAKAGTKLVKSYVSNYVNKQNLNSNEHIIDPDVLTPIQMALGNLNNGQQEEDPNIKYKTLKKKIAPSSKLYNSSYFQAKNKIAPAKPHDIQRALVDMQENKRKVKINEIDEHKINKFRDMGLLTEFNKPLRNYVPDDTASASSKKQPPKPFPNKGYRK